MIRKGLSLASLLFCCCTQHIEPGKSTASGDSKTPDTPGTPSTSDPSTPVLTPSAPPAPGLLSNLTFEDDGLDGWQTTSQPTDSLAASGRRALKLVAGRNYNDAAFLVNTTLFPMQPNAFFVRFYLNLTKALDANHTTFAVAAGDTPDSEVRMGGQFNILVANLAKTDGQRISADSYNGFPHGVQLTPGVWYCMEINFDGVANSLRTWLNDEEIHNLAVTSRNDWNAPPPTDAYMPQFKVLKLGWQSYGAGTDNVVYLDDVAVSHSKIGCRH